MSETAPERPSAHAGKPVYGNIKCPDTIRHEYKCIFRHRIKTYTCTCRVIVTLKKVRNLHALHIVRHHVAGNILCNKCNCSDICTCTATRDQNWLISLWPIT